jgi:hypothetical protein
LAAHHASERWLFFIGISNEVGMIMDIFFESVKSTSKINFIDESLIHKYLQIPVYGTHTQPRELIFQSVVNPVRGGMASRALQKLQYSFTLSASLIWAVTWNMMPPVE